MAKLALFTVRNNESCLKCGAELVIRPGKHDLLLGCSQYPACGYVHPLKSSADGHIVKVLERQAYPACGANLVLHQGRSSMFTGCSNYPECEHTELISEPDKTAITCPQCRTGHLVRRRSRYGKTLYSCDRYPECQFAISFKPIAGGRPGCHYPLFIEKKTAQGVRHFRASKRCGKPISAE